MKVFLTGGTGYLGAALLQGLLAGGHQVSVLSRRPTDLSHPRLTWIRGDLLQGDPPDEILVQHRAVLHSAALVKTWARDPRDFDRMNVDVHDRLLGRCHRLGIPRVLVTSSFLSLGPSPTGRPLTEADLQTRETFLTDYERTKHLADQSTDRWAAQGLAVSTLLPTVIYGAGRVTDGNLVGNLLYRIRTGRFPGIIGSGRQVWSFAYLPDVVGGHLLALDRALPGQRYILGGENRTLEDLITRAANGLGRPPIRRRLPVAWLETLGSLMELGARVTGKAPDLTRGVAGVYRNDYAYHSDKAVRGLGYSITPFEEGLRATFEWVRSLPRWNEESS